MLRSSMVRVEELTGPERTRMRGLMETHFSRVDPQQFEADLIEKEGCIVLHDPRGTIQGFSTFKFLHTLYEGQRVTALFSGDTVIGRDFWGFNELFRAFARLLERMLRKHGRHPCYWFLLTQGIRTYLLLPLGFENFTPRWDREAPAFETSLLNHFATTRYGAAYDPVRGVVHRPNYRLREPFAAIPEHRRANPHVRFFLERNPGFVEGDELACLCRVSPNNFRRRTAGMARCPNAQVKE